MRTLSGIVLLILFWGCASSENCIPDIEQFIADNENINVEVFLGMSIESRGVDINGKRFVKLLYTSRERKRIELPSLQSTQSYAPAKIDKKVYIDFADEFGVNLNQAENYTETKVLEIVNTFDLMKAYKIRSSRYLGDFIEFSITPDCSVWYKLEGAYLNPKYQRLFKNAQEIKPNWYLLKTK